ncbi:MarR family winged helix-turn-helix transcriptional regulator [Haematobacter missouriensis]|uniref:Transcriptional regulator n=1 Tax=Haematobacter missouriensis TaxID=366616 RepID=A0A225CWD3_9RHOB|nr:MarR family transcriptional regulator [Haematobacter missouriensis]OWJ77402.1 transcriptional regulator [Haematobacter missouriensis]OWJ83202.1 transcriptional regulator [Haematobacter missouriensis]
MSSLYTLPGHLIRRLQQIAVALFAARMAEAGLDLTPVQYAALTTIRDNPGIDQATLAGLIAYDRVTLGGVVERLEQKSLVHREVSVRDRRAREIRLTEAGDDLLATALPWVEKVQADIVEALGQEERGTFLSLLSKLTDAGNDRSRAPLRDGRTDQARS